ncbi:MAG: threonine ammonia-lyase [Alsobacter sp.]
MSYACTIDDVRVAERILAGQVQKTPMLPAPRLSAATGAEIFVKYENMQATGSFKERGALSKLSQLTPEERARGVIALSAGNHAQGVAYHARRLGIPATIVMPETTPLVKVENTRAYGATVVLAGETLHECQATLDTIIAAQRLVMVHPYDDSTVMAGQGTIALEMLADAPDLDMLVIPIGGGGLCAGNAVAAKALRPDIRIIGVEAALYPAFVNAIRHTNLPVGGPTLAEGIAVKSIGQQTLPIVRDLVEDIILVDEAAIERGVSAYATLAHTMAEGAGAAGLAAVLAEPARFKGLRIGLILCGGNIDARLLAAIMVRSLEREQRIVSFRIMLPDRPGLLGMIASRLGTLGANILEVSHGRLYLDMPAKGVALDLTIETRGGAHAQQILEALAADGLDPTMIARRGITKAAEA